MKNARTARSPRSLSLVRTTLKKSNKLHHNAIPNAFALQTLMRERKALLEKRRRHLTSLKKIPFFKRVLARSETITVGKTHFTLFTTGFTISGMDAAVLVLDEKLRGIIMCKRDMGQQSWEPLSMSTKKTFDSHKSAEDIIFDDNFKHHPKKARGITPLQSGKKHPPFFWEVNPKVLYEGDELESFRSLAHALERRAPTLDFSLKITPQFVNIIKQYV